MAHALEEIPGVGPSIAQDLRNLAPFDQPHGHDIDIGFVRVLASPGHFEID